MKNHFCLFTLLFCSCLHSLSSQTVSTWLMDGNISDDLIYGPNGAIYGSDFNGDSVFKINPDGTVNAFVSGIQNPNGLAFDNNQNLYVVGWGEGTIWKVDPSGTKEVLIDGLANPSGLIQQLNEDTLLFSAPINNSISKLTLDGIVVPYIADNQLNDPVGLDYNENGELIVANFSDNRIFKVEADESLSLVVNISATPQGIGYIECLGDYIFATMFSSNKIYRTDYDGNFVLVAGSTLGSVDGDASVARFNNPNGILSTTNGDSILVSDYGTGSLRIITGLDLISSIEGKLPVVLEDIQVFPNPTSEKLFLEFSTQEPLNAINWEFIDATGKVIYYENWNEVFSIGNNKLEINLLPEITPGNYFYRLSDETRVLAGGSVLIN